MEHLKSVFFLTLFTLASPLLVQAKTLVATGTVHSLAGQKLFDLKQFKEDLGDGEKETTLYFNKDGQRVLQEKFLMKKGTFDKYEITQLQTDSSAVVKKDDQQLIFETKTNDEQKTKRTSFPDDFAIGSSIVKLAKKNLSHLTKGKDVDFKLGLWARQKLVSFHLRKAEETANTIRIKMRPSNFFVRQFVDDIYFTFDKKSGNLLKYEGRTNLVDDKNGEKDTINAVVKYQPVET